jgi:drug/metabolite transporter (DMT)-like permease
MSAQAGGAPAAAGRASDDLRGGLLIILGGLCFTIVGVTIKQLAGSLPEIVIALWRHIFAVACFAPFILRKGIGAVRTQRYFGHLYRSAFGFISFLGFVYALPRLDLADVTALSFTTPLWSLLLAVLFLGEPVRPSRWLATVLGFGGVLLVARPTSQLQPAVLIALASALFSSLAMMKVKQLSLTEPPDRISFYFLLNGMLFAAPLALPVWRMPDLPQLLLLAVIGGISCLGQLCLSRGYALGQFSKMAPMDFFRLPLAVLLGFALFAELPDLPAFAGMAIIVAASLFILLSRAKPRVARA